MSSTHEKIQQAAHQNEQLLRGLAETDSAPSQLKQQNAYISDLETQIANTTKRVNDLKRKTAVELKDHEKYRDSHFRRWAHKASGKKEKFAEKAAKEEQEYFAAIQEQKSAEDELAYVKQLRAEAENEKGSYEQGAKRHEQLQKELDALYNSIFAGYTPEFPEEDQKEEACNQARQHVHELSRRLECDRQTLSLLAKTSYKLSEARKELDNAYGMSQWDMFGGGTFASMQKRSHLEAAESAIQQVRMLQNQLGQVAPEVQNLGPLNIAMGSILTDVLFDNIFTDMEMHDKIKNSIAQVDNAGNRCGNIIRERERHEKQLRDDVKAAQGRLEHARLELQRAREEAFRRVVGGGQGNAGWGAPPPNDAPPAYSG